MADGRSGAVRAVKYRVTMSIRVEARNDEQAHEYALKLKKLLDSPLVRMAVEGDGVRLSDGGRPIVYEPQPDYD